MARRLGTVGYYVLLPNLYYRAGRNTMFGPDVLEDGSADRERMRSIRTKMTIPPVIGRHCRDVRLYRPAERGKAGASRGHGYCMSGPYGLAAAARYPERIAASSLVLRHLARQRLRRRAHISRWLRSKENSTSPAPSTTRSRLCLMVEELRTLFQRAGTAARSNSIPASIMASPSRSAGCYDKPAAERPWEPADRALSAAVGLRLGLAMTALPARSSRSRLAMPSTTFCITAR